MAVIDEITHGTGHPISAEFVTPMDNIIHRLDPRRNPMSLFFFSLPRFRPPGPRYDWMERSGFYRRTFKAQIVYDELDGSACLGLLLDGKDFDAICAMDPGETDETYMPRLIIKNYSEGETVSKPSVIAGSVTRAGLENAKRRRHLIGESGTAGGEYYYNMFQITVDGDTEADLYDDSHQCDMIIISELYTGSVYDYDADGWGALTFATDPIVTDCYVTVEMPNTVEKGYQQGTGLRQEVKNISHTFHNWTQIFKAHWSVTGTMAATKMIGGPELTKRMIENAISFTSDLEQAILFQGGGTEGHGGDWGMVVANAENPQTVFKGFGVGHAANKDGWIYTNNGNPNGSHDPTSSQVTVGDWSTWVDLMERLWSDLPNASSNKVAFCSTKVLKELSNLPTASDSPFSLVHNHPYGREIGLDIRRILTPFGTLDFTLHPMLSGPFERYFVILDMKNIRLAELRPVKMFHNVGAAELDGRIDMMLGEYGIKVLHEHTHCIGYLQDS